MSNIFEPHQTRVIEEHIELSKKVSSLSDFISGSVYVSLCPSEQHRLKFQLEVMRLYAQVLQERITAFSE
jgi:hypothetical protein